MKNITINRLNRHAKTIASNILVEAVKTEGELTIINELARQIVRTPFEGVRIIVRENRAFWKGCELATNELRNIKKTTQQLAYLTNEVLNRVRRAVPTCYPAKVMLDKELVRMVH